MQDVFLEDGDSYLEWQEVADTERRPVAFYHSRAGHPETCIPARRTARRLENLIDILPPHKLALNGDLNRYYHLRTREVVGQIFI